MTRLMTLMAAALVAIAIAGEAGACMWTMSSPHPIGGGCIDARADVGRNVYVGPDSAVHWNTTISGNVTITGSEIHSSESMPTTISGNVVIRDSDVWRGAAISDNAVIKKAWIHGRVIVSGNAQIVGGSVSGFAEVSGTARVKRGATITGNGQVDCGRWVNITVTTDRRGECGRNGKVRTRDRPTDSNTPISLGDLLSNPLDPGNTGLGE